MTDYKQQDPLLWDAVAKEEERQRQNIELIASENIVSQGVMHAQGSALTNKYAEGYPGKRYYGGTQYVDIVENLAIDRAKELFGAEYANVQPHSGSSANMAAYYALLNHGDRVLAMDLSAGGHLTHGSPVNFSGRTYHFYSYGLDPETEVLDYDKIREAALEVKPKLIVAGASAYSRSIDFKKFKEIADEVDAKLMVDMAHIAGLVASGLHQNPVSYADVVTTTTHKTLRGPRGGLILAKEAYAKAINSAVFPGNQGGPLEHVIAGKAVALHEAMQPAFKEYSKQVIKNAKAMAEVFKESDQVRIVSGTTDNHLLLLDILKTGHNGREIQDLLDTVLITLNKNQIMNDQNGPFKTSGIRLGTPAVTTRGFKEKEVKEVAHLILKAIENFDNEEKLAEVKEQVLALTSQFPLDF
ncbi:serine hydroxymethyltransferase [Holzapfeliella sp. JNUCC 80]